MANSDTSEYHQILLNIIRSEAQMRIRSLFLCHDLRNIMIENFLFAFDSEDSKSNIKTQTQRMNYERPNTTEQRGTSTVNK